MRTEPTVVVPARKSTRLTVPPGVVAVAVKTVGAPTPMFAAFAGEVSEIVGGAALTVTLTPAEVIALPKLSVTRAVKVTAPVAVGLQATVYGLVVAVPREVVPAKNSTDTTVAPLPAVAVAVTLTKPPTVEVELAAGPVTATVGEVTVTLTALDVAVEPFESVTFAVREAVPAAVGVQAIE